MSEKPEETKKLLRRIVEETNRAIDYSREANLEAMNKLMILQNQLNPIEDYLCKPDSYEERVPY